ncbi:Chloride channel protein CLC-d [Spatholobus suberectus]|nr:Chloride channel protein CLC-d [Spatholobus suberectus]
MRMGVCGLKVVLAMLLCGTLSCTAQPRTGLAALFINIAVENFAGWKFSVMFDIIQKSYISGFVVYVLINLVLVYSSVYIITQFAPAAAGSELREYNLDFVDAAILSVHVALAKGMNWDDLAWKVKKEKKVGNPVPGLIEGVKAGPVRAEPCHEQR